MRTVVYLVGVGLLFVAAAGTAAEPPNVATGAYAAAIAAKKVPAADKNAVDIVGKVLGGAGINVCGVPVFTLGLRVGNQIVYAQCPGSSMATTCSQFAVNQRVRLQGTLAQVLDVTTPGFDPCDPGTWQFVIPGISTFVATKSLR